MNELENGYIPPEEEIENVSQVDDSILDLLKDEPKNKWEDLFREKGIPIDVDPQFLNSDRWPQEGVINVDPLTGLPQEDGKLRTMIVENFTKTIKSGKKWAILSGDADNLKVANTREGRLFGNMVIKYGASILSLELAALNFPPEVISVIARQGDAADENVAYLFDISDEYIERLNDVLQRLDATIELDEPRFSFSQTFSLLTSESPEAQQYIQSTQEFLAEHPNGTAYNEFNAIKKHLDDEVKLKKIAKDIKRIPVDRLSGSEGTEDIRNILLEEIGDTRISTPLLEKIMEINEFETHWKYRNAFDTVDAYIAFARKAGISEDMIDRITSDNARVEFYGSLIPEEQQ